MQLRLEPHSSGRLRVGSSYLPAPTNKIKNLRSKFEPQKLS